MTIQYIIELATQHFIDSNYNSDAGAAIYERFTDEQLKQPDEERSDFIDMVKWENPAADQKELDLFYTWYYVNYVQQPIAEGAYTIDLHFDGLPSFTEAIKLPVRLEQQGNYLVATPCDEIDAAFWCVYLLTSNTENVCIADCLNEEAADQLVNLIHQASERKIA